MTQKHDSTGNVVQGKWGQHTQESEMPIVVAPKLAQTEIKVSGASADTHHKDDSLFNDKGIEDNKGMNTSIMNKEQYLQLLLTIVIAVVGTVVAVMSIVLPLTSEKSDAQYQSVMAEIGSLKSDIHSLGENLKDHQTMYERVIDERTKK